MITFAELEDQLGALTLEELKKLEDSLPVDPSLPAVDYSQRIGQRFLIRAAILRKEREHER